MSSEIITVRQPVGDELRACFDLRHLILRVPWNMPREDEPDEEDKIATHFAVFSNDSKVIGYARMDRKSETMVQVRFVAIDNAYQGKGIGKVLMRYIEDYVSKQGIPLIMLHARENAKKFYLDLGYINQGPSYFWANSIQHYHMTKDMTQYTAKL